MRDAIIHFAQNISGCDYYIINWFCGNIMSVQYTYFAYSTHIEAIVCSISYFNCPKYMVAFSAD